MGECRGERGLTRRSFAIGFALVLAWLLFDCMLGNHPSLSAMDLLYQIGFGGLFTLFVVTFFNNRLPEHRRLTRAELTVIYAMVAVAIPWGALLRGAIESPVKLLILYGSKYSEWARWMGPPWCPKSDDAIDAFRRGGVPFSQIPWRHWMGPMVYWSAMLVSFQALAIFTVLFFRQLFVEEEKLPFPLATAGATLIDHRPPKEESPSGRRFATVLRVAYLGGLLICLPGILEISPEGGGPIPMNVVHYSTTTGVIPGQFIRLSWDPFVLCVLMLFPADVLFTVVLFTVTMRIAMPALFDWFGIGMAGGVADFFSEGWILQVFGIGGLAGLIVWTLFFNRRRLWVYLRAALAGGREPRGNNPLSYRVVVIGLVVSAAAFVALMVYGLGDVPGDLARNVISIIIALAIIFGMLFAIMRQTAEAGWQYHSPWSPGKVIGYADRFYLTHPAPLWQTRGSFFAIGDVIHFGAYHNTFSPHINLFYAFRIAHDNNTDTRGLFKAVTVTLLLAVPLVMVGYLVLIHHYGFDHGFTAAEYANYTYSQPMVRMAWASTPTLFSKIPPWFSVPLGVAVIGVVMVLRRERVRFPLNPVGIVLAAALSMHGYGTPDIWFPMLIVLVVKRGIYRWFGVRFFRERTLPAVVFVMMGLMTGMLVYRILFAAMGHGFLQPY